MGVLTREYVKGLISREKKWLDELRDYDLGKWRLEDLPSRGSKTHRKNQAP